MRWARVAVVLGALIVCAAFALGTEAQPLVMVDGETATCGAAIPAEWLMSGSPSGGETGGGTAVERRLAAACEAKTEHTRWALGGLAALGGLMVLVGWTAVRERAVEHASRVPERSL